MTKGKKNSPAEKSSTGSRGREKKVVTEAPASAGVDKEKMAAFFASSSDDNPPATETETPTVEESKDVAPPAAHSEAVPASLEDDDSFSLVFLFIILGAMAIGWFYYVSPKAVHQPGSRSLIPTAAKKVSAAADAVAPLKARIKALEAEVARLKAQLAAYQAKADVQPPVAKKSPAPVKKSPVSEQKAPAAVQKGSSFDKAPVPFWRQESFKSPQARAQAVLKQNAARKESAESGKTAAKPATDSFSKAPKPFWLKDKK